MSEVKKYPEVTTGAVIYNDKKEILLIKNKKWGDSWSIPGGHVEAGETLKECIIRETLEETGLKIGEIEFISVSDGINLKNFHEKRHFIFVNYFAKVIGGKETKTSEMVEYGWFRAEKALKLKLSGSIKPLVEEFVRREKEGDESWEYKYTRALADYQNLAKQHDKDRQEFIKYALNDFLHEILPVYDHLRMSLVSLNDDEEKSPWVEGVKYVLKQFKDVLENKGIEEIKTKGEKFDHHTMEAVEGKGDKVKKEIMPGYKLNGRVIRPARVIVE